MTSWYFVDVGWLSRPGMTLPEKKGDSYVLTYNDYEDEQGHLPARCEYICDVYDIYIYIYIYSI